MKIPVGGGDNVGIFTAIFWAVVAVATIGTSVVSPLGIPMIALGALNVIALGYYHRGGWIMRRSKKSKKRPSTPARRYIYYTMLTTTYVIPSTTLLGPIASLVALPATLVGILTGGILPALALEIAFIATVGPFIAAVYDVIGMVIP